MNILENKKGITSTTLDVAGMGNNASNILENFIGSKKMKTLKNALKNDPKIRITVSFFEGKMFDYSGVIKPAFDINKINF